MTLLFLGPLECLSRARGNFLDHFESYSLFGDLTNLPTTELGIWSLRGRVLLWEIICLSWIWICQSYSFKRERGKLGGHELYFWAGDLADHFTWGKLRLHNFKDIAEFFCLTWRNLTLPSVTVSSTFWKPNWHSLYKVLKNEELCLLVGMT